MSAGEPAAGLLRIVRGRPSPEELAAVSVVLYALAARREQQAESGRTEYWDLVTAGDGMTPRSVLRRMRGDARSWTSVPFPMWRAWQG